MTRRAATIRADSANAVDTITLEHADRHRRRKMLTSDNGIAFLLDLPEARHLRDGDGLELDDGRVIRVVAAPEPLHAVTAGSPALLARLAWHLGNRHHPAQVSGERILVRRDHVIGAMLQGLGATVTEVTGPFDPEGGAYDQDPESGGRHRHG